MGREYRIVAIIVNYRTPKLTLDCTRTLGEQLDPEQDRILIVDNNSGQEDVAEMRGALGTLGLSTQASILPLRSNGGFSAGNNAGIRELPARYYLLANSDTLFLPGAVSELLAAASVHPKAGILSPRLEWPDGEAQVSCFKFITPFSEAIRSAETGIVTSLLRRFNVPVAPLGTPSGPEWTSFACVLIRREVFQRVGLLDEGYFMYFEDTDFCRRTRQAGFNILNWPRARVVHLQGRSSGFSAATAARKQLPEYFYLSRSRYFTKFYGKLGYLSANLCWLAGRLVSLFRQAIGQKDSPVPQAESTGIWRSRPETKT